MLFLICLVLPGASTTEGRNRSANWSCSTRKKTATGTAGKIIAVAAYMHVERVSGFLVAHQQKIKRKG